ncbi:MAG: glycosyltransferase [Chitinophagaceae bacterium]|nr:glycosyltransferase [Chitinophagaceae bacterium]
MILYSALKNRISQSILYYLELSVIIVNYNVKHFLEQCLCSVQKAIPGIDAEVIVTDNNSTDSSISYLQPAFPSVVFLSNQENTGFSRACNQGLAISKGKYVLFLNPDTLVPEDCFSKCIAFLDAHPDAGALGIHMLDGSGKFLKESKRAFPAPLTSLYKLFGLARVFPQSRTFAKYHLEYLAEKENHEVDVLAGAFIMVKRAVLEKTGSFDETFFMYGEDIDLSYRIQEAGYKNYYFAESSIIHFKGESTRKLSLNYVRMFYNAMNVFVKKHYGRRRAGLFNFIIHVAIWMRAGLSATGRFIERIGLPLIDAGLILLSFVAMKNVWQNVRPEVEYKNLLLWIAFPAFTFVYLLVAYYAGLYDRRYRQSKLIRSTLISTLSVLAGYSLLPEKFRFSRAIVLLGALLAFFLISALRWLLIRWRVLDNAQTGDLHPKTLITASPEEFENTLWLMKEAGLQERVIGRIAVDENDEQAVGHWKNIKLLAGSFSFSEIIFCEGTLSFKNIIEAVQELPGNITAKFHAAGSHSIVGSDSKDESGEALSKENGYKLSDPYNRRLKRLIDILFSVFSLITFPVHLIGVKKPVPFFGNCFSVLFAHKTWIGYALHEKQLPALRQAVIACNGTPLSSLQHFPEESLKMVDQWWARDYEPVNDLKLLWKAYRNLGG